MATANLTRGLDRDQWLDRPALATLMEKTEDTVRRIQRDHALPTRLGPNGCVLLRLGDFIDLGRIPASVLDPQISAREVADAIALRAELEELRRAHAELAGRYAEHTELVAELRAQHTEIVADLRAHVATQAVHIADLRSAAAVTDERDPAPAAPAAPRSRPPSAHPHPGPPGPGRRRRR